MSIEIEKHVPVPDDYQHPRRIGKYPFHTMKNMDSFFVPHGKRETVLQSFSNWKRELPEEKKSLYDLPIAIQRTEMVNDKEVEGVRFWIVFKEKKSSLPSDEPSE